jgi:hypothetical protein
MESFQDRFIAAINERIANSKCPLCGSSDWNVEDGVYLFRKHVRNEGGESWAFALPSAALVCNICGDIQFVSLQAPPYGNSFKGDL